MAELYRMRRNPNIILTGQILTGKSAIACTLETAFGYESINTGIYLRQHLARTVSPQRDFTHNDYRTAREALIAQRGPLYFLPGTTNSTPTVVDGVRSPVVMAELAAKGFSGVLVTAPDHERLSRAKQLIAADLGKHVLETLGDLQKVDAAQEAELTQLHPYVVCEVENDGRYTLEELCGYIISSCMDAPS